MGHAQWIGPAGNFSASNGSIPSTGSGDRLSEQTHTASKPHLPPDYTGIIVEFQEDAHIGKRKKEQQDAHGHLFLPPDPNNGRPGCYLFVVADGVSMGQAGALASMTAVTTMLKNFRHLVEDGQHDLSLALEAAYAAANVEVYQLAKTRPGMATTCTAALIAGQQIVTAHVGDSRAYLSRPGKGLMPLSVDHSWVAEMGESLVQQGLMTREELQRDARRHTITRAFGVQEKFQADFNSAQIEEDDLVILCTDGLWDVLPEGRLERAVPDNNNLADFNRKLIEEALDNGGRDNITISVMRVERLGPPAKMPGLQKLLENTARDLAERTRPITMERQRRGSNPAPLRPLSPASTINELLNPVEPPAPQETLRPSPASAPFESRPARPDNSWEIDDPPSYRLPTYNPEMQLSKAQKTFALGEWDAAIGQFIDLELMEASYQGLFESLSGALIRYIGIAIGEGRGDQADALIKRLEGNNISRYTELLADYCNEEGRRAANAGHYQAARSYAQFGLRLRPSDVRARTLSELSELYLGLARPKATLSERLATAQKIYARDENFGAIQDELACIYMELGDDAIQSKNLEDAGAWYGMIMPLRPSDAEVLSEANNKLRAVKDELGRQPGYHTSRIAMTPAEMPSAANPSMPTYNAASTTIRAPERERIINDGKPEIELVNRLKDRVSRAQKAWDGGRKEVGSEYIYLVYQLNDLMMPNPWQSTLPRVCYDFGKWLLEQKQYEEARPYFQKASQLGMAAAQQRLSEVDRLIRERGPAIRYAMPANLPPAPTPPPASPPMLAKADPEPVAPVQPRSTLANMASIFTSTRKAATSQAEVTAPPLAGAVITPNVTPIKAPPATIEQSSPRTGSLDMPFLTPRIEAPAPHRPARSGPIVSPTPPPPTNTTFVGASHAGDGILSAKLPPNPPIGSLGNIITPPPRQAAAIASGNWNWAATTTNTTPPALPADNQARPGEPENTVQFASNGTLRGPIAGLTNPLHAAVSRESKRLADTGQPQSLEPKRAARRKLDGVLGIIKGVLLPGLALGVVILAILLVFITVLPKLKQPAQPTLPAGVSQITSAPPTPGATVTSSPVTIPPLSGVNGVVRVEGARVEDLKIFLATAGDPNSPYRELSQEGGYFRLPISTLNKLDPKQKYTLVARPKDTAERKFAENLPPEHAAQQPFAIQEVSYDPSKGFDVLMRISPEALAFYPLKGADGDSDVTGGRYIGATKHSIRGEYLKYYNDNGGLARFGFPLSEEFDWAGNGRVQFYERGWLAIEPPGKVVTVGKVGKALLESSCTSIPRVPANVIPIAIPTLKADPDFAAQAGSMKLGVPQTTAFDLTQGPIKTRMQYFDAGRLELNLADKKAAPGLGLLGAEYSRCLGWYK